MNIISKPPLFHLRLLEQLPIFGLINRFMDEKL